VQPPRPKHHAHPTSSASISSRREDADLLSQDSQTPYYGTATVLDPGLHVSMVTHSEVRDSYVALRDHSPAYVVLYDPDITLIRCIEAYQSTLPPQAPAVKVYFILYGELTVLDHSLYRCMQMLGVGAVCIDKCWSILQLGLYIAVMFLCWAALVSSCITLCVLLRVQREAGRNTATPEHC
jgi:hypothetical protein